MKQVASGLPSQVSHAWHRSADQVTAWLCSLLSGRCRVSGKPHRRSSSSSSSDWKCSEDQVQQDLEAADSDWSDSAQPPGVTVAHCTMFPIHAEIFSLRMFLLANIVLIIFKMLIQCRYFKWKISANCSLSFTHNQLPLCRSSRGPV